MCTGIALDVDGGALIGNDILYEDYFAVHAERQRQLGSDRLPSAGETSAGL
jgi:hypothetical protein